MTCDETSPDDAVDARTDRWLRAGAGGSRTCERVIETSISWVYLYEDRALKLKKPVNFDFVDFSTLDQRGWAARRELMFNRLTAPDLYRGVHAITRAVHGGLEMDGPGAVLDWVVEMRRFDDDALLSRRLPADGAMGEALGREIARVHLAAAQGLAGGGAEGLAYVISSNTVQLQDCSDVLDAEPVQALIAATQDAFMRVSGLLDQRYGQGFCRACHGDLHTANIIIEDGAPIVFDGIDFNDRLREIDIGYDLAFLLMDLTFRGSEQAANRALNGWLDAAARAFDGALWEGLGALPLFQSVRAAVRAHVSAREGKANEARRYLASAREYLRPAPARLLAIGGLSGTGKTTLAHRLAPSLGAAPGAVVLRSDEIRKRLWNCAPLEPLGPQAYTPAASERVYEAMMTAAGACLAAGCSVIADAVFLDRGRRAQIEALAHSYGVAFEGIWLDAPDEILAARLGARRGDASDADSRVLERQRPQAPGEITWRRQVST